MSRLRANKITNQLADGSPTVEKGLIIAGVTTTTNATVSSNITLGGDIIHSGDDTKIRFPSNDTITFETSGNEAFRIHSSGQLIMTNATTQNFFDFSTTNNNTRGLFSIAGKDSSGNAVTVKIGGFGDTSRGEIFTHSNHGLGFATNNAATQMTLTTAGKVLIGSVNHNTLIGSGVGSQLQVEGNTYQTSSLALINNQTSTDPAFLLFGKSRAGTAGGNTIVQNGDRLGGIRWCGADGTDLHSYGATIEAYVDGAPGSNDLPGRIVIATTPDGSSYPTDHEILYGSTKEIRNSGYYVAQTSGSGTSSQTASFGATQSGMANSAYNYILSGSNDTGNKCVLFVNGSTRGSDGGNNGMTLRNDGGPLTLGSNSQRTTLRGDYVLYPERPAFHVTNFTWSNSTKYAHGGTATYNRGSHWNVSTGTFTAPVGGDYVFFCSVQVHAPNEISGRNATYSNLHAEKNGSIIGGEIVGTVQIGSYAFHGTLSHSLVVYLAANDTFRWNSTYGFRYGQNTLYGYLLG